MEYPSGLRTCRTLLALTAVGLPLIAFVMWWTGSDLPLALWFRVPVACLAGGLLVGSFTSDRVRAGLLPRVAAIACAIELYFIYQGATTGMGQSQVVGIALASGVALMLCRSAVEVSVFAVASSAMAIAFYRDTPPPEVPLAMFLVTHVLLCVGIGSIHLGRIRLQTDLLRASERLEQRVAERTADLRTEAAERRNAEQQALQANRAKSTFLANMSHELRTPLNAIIGYTEICLESLETGGETDDLQPDLARVRESARHLLTLIDDVLDLARIEAGGLQPGLSSFASKPLLEEVGQALHAQIVAGGNTFSIDSAEDPILSSDRVLLKQILTHLCANAAKFTRQGRIEVRVRSAPDDVHIAVSDTGIGIAPDQLGRLFQPFGQLDDGPTRVHGGQGLGLALCRELAKRLDGTITVQSTPGVGSTFVLCLRQTARPPEAQPVDRASGAVP